MPEPTTHRITTTAELVAAATDENIDYLMRDLEEWLRWHLVVRTLPVPVTMGTEFVWTDDGDPGPGTITVAVSEPPTQPREQG